MTESATTKTSILQPFYDHARLIPARVLRDVEVLRRIVDLHRVYASTDLDALGPENRLRIVAGRETLEGVLEELADIYREEKS